MSESNGNATVEAQIAKADESGVVELHAAEFDAGAGASTQPEVDIWTPEDTIEPPEDPRGLARLTTVSSIRATCLEAMTRNVVGLGWDVDTWEGREDESSPKLIAEARFKLDTLARRDKRLDRPSFTTLMEAIKHDEEETGTGYLEVSRNRRTGLIDGLYHAPGALLRRRHDRKGYVMGQNETAGHSDFRRVDYVNFGEKVAYDKQGRPQPKLNREASGWQHNWAHNEIIAFRLYTSETRDYGLPRDAALAIEYAAYKFLEEWTSSFFNSSGTPPMVIFVQGSETKEGNRVRLTVPPATTRRIQQAMRSDGALGSQVAIVPLPPGAEVKDVKLGQLSDRDLTFGEFKKLHRRNVGGAFRLSPIFYGDVDDAGRYTAEVQRAITLEQVFDPDQRRYEDRLWNTLMVDLGYSPLKIVFKRLAVEGDAAKKESANNMAEKGAITMREYRAAHGKGPLDEKIHGEGVNDRLVEVAKPRGSEGRVDVKATEDQRGLRPGIGERVAKAASTAGAMVCLYAPDELAKKLAISGGEKPEDLHVTLAFLGADASVLGEPASTLEAVSRWARMTPPLIGVISGSGEFVEGPGSTEPVTIAHVDLPDLPRTRERLLPALRMAGTPASSEHGFTPHITLAYARKPSGITEQIPVRFEHVTVRWGEQRFDIPLTGTPIAKSDDHEHGVEHVEEEVAKLADELAEQIPEPEGDDE